MSRTTIDRAHILTLTPGDIIHFGFGREHYPCLALSIAGVRGRTDGLHNVWFMRLDEIISLTFTSVSRVDMIRRWET